MWSACVQAQKSVIIECWEVSAWAGEIDLLIWLSKIWPCTTRNSSMWSACRRVQYIVWVHQWLSECASERRSVGRAGGEGMAGVVETVCVTTPRSHPCCDCLQGG